jgi:hypothetical protein
MMKVFISWSGSLGGQVAEELRKWLPLVVQSVDPYLSSEDTHKGTRWRDVVGKELENSNYGIICVTPDSIDSKWLNFEAGALSKELKGSYVSPFLVRLKPADLESSPLTQFQMTVHHDFQDVLKLMKSINSASERPLQSEHLKSVFETWWPRLRDPINQLIKDHLAQKPLQPGHNTEEKIENLLILARGHEKILSDLSRTLKSSRIGDSALQVPNLDNAGNIEYLLNKAYSIADEVARSGTSDSRSLVQVRGLIGVIEKELFGKK